MITWMNTVSATAALPYRPDPPRDPAAGDARAPTRTGRLLGMLHKLIDYGKDLVHSLQQRTAATARHFGTLNILLILSRITRGLRLATALEARLVSHPLREPATPAAARAPSDRAPPTAKPATPRANRTASLLPDVPTAEEIAEALRHRPVGEVIADICRDLGIVQSHPLWGEVLMVVNEFGGNYVRLFKDILDRVNVWILEACALENERPMPLPQAVAACGTGPP